MATANTTTSPLPEGTGPQVRGGPGDERSVAGLAQARLLAAPAAAGPVPRNIGTFKFEILPASSDLGLVKRTQLVPPHRS